MMANNRMAIIFNKLKKEDLLFYEAPTITEFLSFRFLQDVMARYIAWKINRKWRRYEKRLAREEFINKYINKDNL
jgi:hypothetical protein